MYELFISVSLVGIGRFIYFLLEHYWHTQKPPLVQAYVTSHMWNITSLCSFIVALNPAKTGRFEPFQHCPRIKCIVGQCRVRRIFGLFPPNSSNAFLYSFAYTKPSLYQGPKEINFCR